MGNSDLDMHYVPDGVSREVGRIVAAVINEVHYAVDKHGFDRTPMNPRMPMSERLVILMEEVGEVARACTYDNAKGAEELENELIQVAAMAIASVIGVRGSRNVS